MYIAIIKTKKNNHKSVANVLKLLTIPFKITNKMEIIKKSIGIIFPGVGSFDETIKELENYKLLNFLRYEIQKNKKPYLGICLGMQILFKSSSEGNDVNGLGILEGKIMKLKKGNFPLPHIGWSDIKINKYSRLLKNINKKCFFYFNHSYCANTNDKKAIILTSTYKNEFISMVEKKNVIGLQFHPEKSQDNGIKIFENFYKFYCYKYSIK